MIVLIPAYEPGAALIDLVRSIRTAAPGIRVVVVDDGSGPRYRGIFDAVAELGSDVLTHATNRGKGVSLKSGFRHIALTYPRHDVVCADCDGQHTVVDILRVADQVRRSQAAMVLGVRAFAGDVPLRSRLGNWVSRVFFKVATGQSLSDTQTGLRGYLSHLLGWLQAVGGDRYEYELNVLLRVADSGMSFDTVGISTVYLDANESSHFRPVVDSVRIYAPLLKFAASSLAAFAIDVIALLALFAATGSLVLSVVAARVISSSVNFLVNRRFVFEHGRDKPTITAAAQYFALVTCLLGLNYASLLSLQTLGLPLLPAKLLTEVVLFAISWVVQRRFVFVRRTLALPGLSARVEQNSATVDTGIRRGGESPFVGR